MEIVMMNLVMQRETHKLPCSISKEYEFHLSYIETILFYVIMGSNQAMMAVGFHRGYPFKKNVIKNSKLIIYFIFLQIFVFSLMFNEFLVQSWSSLTNMVPLIDISRNFKIKITIFIILFDLVIFSIEKVLNAKFLFDIQRKYLSSKVNKNLDVSVLIYAKKEF